MSENVKKKKKKSLAVASGEKTKNEKSQKHTGMTVIWKVCLKLDDGAKNAI